LVVCDNRLVTTGYGRRLLNGLPPMRRLEAVEGLWQALADISASHRG